MATHENISPALDSTTSIDESDLDQLKTTVILSEKAVDVSTNSPEKSVASKAKKLIGKKRRDVNSVIEKLQKKQSHSEVVFSSEEVPLPTLEDCYDRGEAFAEGGQGILYHGFDRKLQRLVALKSMRPELTKNKRLRGLFLSEARVTAQLDHPAIVPIYTLNSDERDGLNLSMKLVNGQTFKSYLDQICTHYRLDGVRSFDEKKALRYRLEIFLKVCDALEYAHSRNVMHCDLKPSNIMIGEYYETYIMDWGIARKIHVAEGEEEPKHTVSGTPQYLAPELIKKHKGDQRIDIFAMGEILFEAVMLKSAFVGDSVTEILMNINAGRVEPFEHRFHTAVDSDLKAIIRKALATNPEQRYNQIAELSADLRRYLMGLEIAARPDNLIRKVLRYLYLHRRFTLTFSMCALLLGASAAAFASYREFRNSERQRIRDYALGVAYSQATHSGYLLDEQFSKFELMTDTLSADIQFMLKNDPHWGGKDSVHERENAWYSVAKLRKDGSPGMTDSMFHRGMIDVGAIAYNVTPDTDRTTLEQRLEPISRFVPRLLQTILESPPGIKIGDDNLETQKNKAFEHGTPIVRVVFGFPDGLFVAYPASRNFPETYDPRNRIWYPAEGSWKGGRAIWTQPYIDSIPEIGLVISCSVPLHVLNMRGSGVCAVDISISELIEALHNTPDAGRIVEEKAIVDSEGRIIVSTTKSFADAVMHRYRRSNEQVVFRKLENDTLLNAMKKRKFGIITVNGNSQAEEVYTFFYISSVNWFYVEKINMTRLLEYCRNLPLRSIAGNP
ncbi:MAG: protein kinase [Victivallales bacterium]|jgi:tRNA A-37 threonylcarbamoyl transferase component Bud32|nr:protein kinase [Victivallales bacterium]